MEDQEKCHNENLAQTFDTISFLDNEEFGKYNIQVARILDRNINAAIFLSEITKEKIINLPRKMARSGFFLLKRMLMKGLL